MKAFVTCTHCRGSGQIEMTGVYAETLNIVVRHPGLNGAALAELAGCKPTAMNNRLKSMERRGVVVGTRFGRSILWTRKKN